MGDIHAIIIIDRFKGKYVLFYEAGQFKRPIMTMSTYDFDKLIEEYKEDTKDFE